MALEDKVEDKLPSAPSGAYLSGREQIVVGKIVRLFGLEGKVKVFSYMEPRADKCSVTWCVLRRKSFEFLRVLAHGKGFVVIITGIEKREQASVLVGEKIGVRESSLEGRGEYCWRKLCAMRSETVSAAELGVVREFLKIAGNRIMEVNRDDKQILALFSRPRRALAC